MEPKPKYCPYCGETEKRSVLKAPFQPYPDHSVQWEIHCTRCGRHTTAFGPKEDPGSNIDLTSDPEGKRPILGIMIEDPTMKYYIDSMEDDDEQETAE
jgi:hypothetical protein